jgi:hypothetical protein
LRKKNKTNKVKKKDSVHSAKAKVSREEEEEEEEEEGYEDKKKKSQVPKKNSTRKGLECSQVEKKIKRNNVKKKDSVHSAKAKGSKFKRSQKKDSVVKDDTNMAIYGEKADNRSLEFALMKKINSANLKQKLAQTIKTSMSVRNIANQLEVHVSKKRRQKPNLQTKIKLWTYCKWGHFSSKRIELSLFSNPE